MKTLKSLEKRHFFDWVFTQPGDQSIEHSDWCGCAFGEWVEALGIDPDFFHNFPRTGPTYLKDLDHINDCPVFCEINKTGNPYENYRELQTLIAKYYKEYKPLLEDLYLEKTLKNDAVIL